MFTKYWTETIHNNEFNIPQKKVVTGQTCHLKTNNLE